MKQVFVAAIIGVILLYQVYVNLLVSKVSGYSRQQRLYQSLLIWLLPLIRALLCHFVLYESQAKLAQRRSESRSLEDDPYHDVYGGRLETRGRRDVKDHHAEDVPDMDGDG